MAIQRVIEIPLSEVQNENYYDIIEREGEHADTCIICGRRLKNQNYKLVHYLTNGNIVSYSGEDIENSQGFFPVGLACAKKLVIQFAF